MYLKTLALDSVTIVLPVQDETYSLRQTVDSIIQSSKPYLHEILIVLSEHTSLASLAAIDDLVSRFGNLIIVHLQSLPYLGGALREAFDLARGSHVILMASDLETDPSLIPVLIDNARQNPNYIITVNRWGGGFTGYNPIKLLANAVFQKLFSLLYWTDLSDLTYAYRIFPTKLVQAIKWTELGHPFLFETILKPLRLGVPITEIPGHWRARTEGVSHNPFMRNFKYIKVGLQVRFMDSSQILRPPSSSQVPIPEEPRACNI